MMTHRLTLSLLLLLFVGGPWLYAQQIAFADPACKRICVKYFDQDFDGEISVEEAAAVTDLRKCFFRSNVRSFDEFQYFTSVTQLPNMAFRGSSLERITLPESVRMIGKAAFADCASLEEIHLPEALVQIEDSAFSACQKLRAIEVPSHVETIGYQAFAGCSALERIQLPASVQLLGDDAFFASGLRQLILLGKKAPSVPALVLPDTIQEIVVPRSALSSYRQEDGWERYAAFLQAASR